MLEPFFYTSMAFTVLSTFFGGYFLLQTVLLERVDLGNLPSRDRDRVIELRRKSRLYQLFEPVLQGLAENRHVQRLTCTGVLSNYLDSGACHLPLHTNELAGLVVIRSMLVAVVSVWLGIFLGGTVAGIFLGSLVFACYPMLHAYHCKTSMENRLSKINRRLPYVIDLLAMQLEAGLSFSNGIELIATELKAHPLGVEFNFLLQHTRRGMSIDEAMENLSKRIVSEDVKDFVESVRSGKTHGTPIATTLKNIAAQMRRRRSERAERAAGKAQANITFPGLIVMGACLLILLAPFALHVAQEDLFGQF